MIGKDASVLIVDDNRALLEYLSEILRDEGYRIGQCPSGQCVLERLEREAYDVILADIRMPGMSGVELVRHLRARRLAVPVIAMTAYAQDALLAEARSLGVLDILTKPLCFDRLLELVASVPSVH